jgi:hypothetical protein
MMGVNYRHEVAQMKLDTNELRRSSALFWFTLIIPIGIIAIGINFILNPAGASAAYGVAISDPSSFPFMWIKGIRDIFSGLVILPFLLNGNRKVTGILFAISIFIPFCDGFVTIAHSRFATPLLIHWGTALYMIIVAAFLLRNRH